MKLTKREKWLLSVLSIILSIMGLYNFFIQPRLNKIEALNQKYLEYSSKVESVRSGISAYDKDLEEIDNLYKEINNSTKEFFPEIKQDNIINLIDDMISNSQTKGTKVSFSPSKISNLEVVEEEEEVNKNTLNDLVNTYKFLTDQEEIVNSNDNSEIEKPRDTHSIEVMSAVIEFEGEYNGIIELIKNIEGYDKRIVISNLNIYREDPVLFGTITIDFYSIPKLFNVNYDSNYYNWDYNYTSPKDNPFR